MANWIDISKTYTDHPDFTPNKFSAELSIGHTVYIERLPTQPENGWMLDGLDYVEHPLHTEDAVEAQKAAIELVVKRAKTIAQQMQEAIKELSWESIELIVPLPDGRYLAAYDKRDTEYPGVQIEVRCKPNNEGKYLAWVEYNTVREEYTDDKRLRTLLFKKHYFPEMADEPPVINMGYDHGDLEES